MEIQSSYGRPDIEERDDGIIHVRASAVGGCYRRLWYVYWGYSPSDERPRATRNRLAAGTLLEEIITEDLEESGAWEIQPWQHVPKTQNVLEYPILDKLVATGTPDALGYYKPNSSLGEWLPLEFKTRAPVVFNETRHQGNVKRNPDAVAQLAIYRHALVDNGFISQFADSAISSMNIVNGEVYTEFFRPGLLDQVMDQIYQTMELFYSYTLPNEDPPERPYKSDSWQCRGCPMRTTCWGFGDNERRPRDIPMITDEDLAAQFAIWEDAKILDKENEIDEDLDKHTKQLFRDFLDREMNTKMKISGRTGNWAVSIRGRTNEKIDHDRLRYYLSPEQIEEVLTENKTKFIDIRRTK